ncbi:PfkB family carbohydrate kinase [Brachybacterium sp. sponge]|uniref:PfkB family carbohydrate kinase n=1 Tax=Brachybacterium sp. sponge TaxID=1775432 RepID=UPI0007A42766|nr:PfkB family carbohydrate kinase [Brachybacterium sp. sponge]
MTAPVGSGRVLHAGQAVVDVVLRIPGMPEPGGDVFAAAHRLVAGGGVNTMAAAARDGAEVVYLGSHGTGPFGNMVRAALAEEGVRVLAAPDPQQDTGFSVALVDDSAERTFVSTRGAEAETPLAQLLAGAPVPGDVVCVSGYSLVHPVNRESLIRWLPGLEDGVQVVVDPSPVIGEVDLESVHALLARADVWTTNEREARLLVDRLDAHTEAPARTEAAPAGANGIDPSPDGDLLTLASRLCALAGAVVLLRAGARGAVLAHPDREPLVLPPLPVTAVDTNGAGDAHTGVLCARLAAGEPLEDAARRAGVAAAIAVTRHGPATSPTAAEIDHALTSL